MRWRLIRFLANPVSDLRAAAFLRSRFIRLSDAGLSRLAPRLASALMADTDADQPGVMPDLDEEDRRVLSLARQFVPEWIARVDRCRRRSSSRRSSPRAYAYELAGGRGGGRPGKTSRRCGASFVAFKTVATPRWRGIADHLDSLTAGDESNAVLEALDAVNLMTVHASKGLEFPIVFVVNMARARAVRRVRCA